jgi:hypothetical protein
MYGTAIDPELMAMVEEASFGRPLEFLTGELVWKLHEAVRAAEIEKRRRAAQARK